MIDLRFPTALQMLLSLALSEEEGFPRMSSSQLAKGVNVNPAFVRKLLVPLVRDGLITSTMGKNGGVQLARPAQDISYREIFTSVTEGKKLWTARGDVPHRCLVSTYAVDLFEALADDAEMVVLELLATRNLRAGLEELRGRDKAAGSTRSAPEHSAAL